MKFGLDDRHWSLLEDLLIKPLRSQGAQIWVFGSRATGQQKQYSDIDILYKTKSPLPENFIGTLEEHLEASSLPIKVDLVDENALAESYQKSVFAQRVEI